MENCSSAQERYTRTTYVCALFCVVFSPAAMMHVQAENLAKIQQGMYVAVWMYCNMLVGVIWEETAQFSAHI